MPKKKPDDPSAPQEPRGQGRQPKSAGEPRQKTSISFPVEDLNTLRMWAAARRVDVQDIVVEAVQEKMERDRERIRQDILDSLPAKK